MGALLRRPGQALPLSYKLMLATLCFCAVFTVLTVLLRIGLSWRTEVAKMANELEMIDRIVSHDISRSLWEVDRDALQSQLKSIADIEGVADVELTIVHKGASPEVMRQIYPDAAVPTLRTPSVRRQLAFASTTGATQILGELKITGDDRVLWQRLKDDVSGIVLAQIVQALLLSGLIMWLFHRSVTVHVRRVAQHLDAVRPETLEHRLQLDRPLVVRDELSLLVDGVNTLQSGMSDHLQRQLAAEHSLAAHRDHLSELVAAGTAELRTANTRLEEMVRSDSLTGLANRRCFDEMKEAEGRRAVRGRHPLSVLLCDVDYFKRYNDTYGHAAGDACLRAVAEVLRAAFRRAGELPARIGGEEFAVLLPGVTLQQAVHDAERLRLLLVERAIPHADSHIAAIVTMSIGVAELTAVDDGAFDDVLRRADKALYRAKNDGRNRVVGSTDADVAPVPAVQVLAVSDEGIVA